MPFVLSPRAQADLADIWDYTAHRWGRRQAERYLRQIQSTVVVLSTNPAMGRSVAALRAGYRKQPCGRHVIFYRQTDIGIDIVRILHERMDFESHLWDRME